MHIKIKALKLGHFADKRLNTSKAIIIYVEVNGGVNGMNEFKFDSHKNYKIDPLSEIYYSLKIRPLINKAIERLDEITGLDLPMPKLELHNVPEDYGAQLYKLENGGYRLIIWVTRAVFERKDVIPHEVYHEAQEEYKKINGDGDSEERYVANASLRGQAAANKASALWNGVNEAGAYILGYAEAFRQEGLEGRELGIKVLREIINWSGTAIGSAGNKVLDLLFTDKGIESVSELEMAKADVVLITAAIILWQNDFDVYKAAKHLLQDPAKTIDEILSMGSDKVVEILKSIENISEA